MLRAYLRFFTVFLLLELVQHVDRVYGLTLPPYSPYIRFPICILEIGLLFLLLSLMFRCSSQGRYRLVSKPMKSVFSFLFSSTIRPLVTLLLLTAAVLILVFLLEKLLPFYSFGPIPVLIAVFAGGRLSQPFDAYLRRRFTESD
jgi:hypothetical protein